MKYIFVLLMTCQLSASAKDHSFSAPDYNEIEKTIKEKTSVYYYPSLFKRYTSNDTSLKAKDFIYLYYGYFFNKNYSGFISFAKRDTLKSLLNKPNISKEDYKLAISYEKEYLDRDPFNISQINTLRHLYENINEYDSAEIYNFKLRKILYIIKNSGDGLSEETAYHVLSVSDEYSFLNALGYNFGGQQTLTKKVCDYLTIAKNDDGIEGIYFDAKQIMRHELGNDENGKPTMDFGK